MYSGTAIFLHGAPVRLRGGLLSRTVYIVWRSAFLVRISGYRVAVLSLLGWRQS